MSDLPKNWIEIPLQVGLKDLLTGRRPKGGVQGITEGLLSLGGEHINVNGYINLNKPRYIPIDFAQKIPTAQVMANDILVVKDGATTARVGLVDNRFTKIQAFVNEHLFLCRPNEFLDPIFLYHYLKSEKGLSAILSDFRGAAQGGISRQFIDKVFIPIPPIAEQKRIVTKLDNLFAHTRRAREELDHIPKLIERYKQAILSAAISGVLIGVSHQSKSNIIPLSNILSEIKTGPFGSSLHKSDYILEGTPIINPMHINNGKITPSMEMTISSKKADELSDYVLKSGDVILARRGAMGRCAVVQRNQEGWLCGTGSMILRAKSNLLPEYLQLFLSSSVTIKILEADAVGSTMVNLNQRILSSLKILLPSLEEQEKIIKKIERCFQAIDRLEQEYQKAVKLCDRLEQSTLAKAFRGELVPQDPNDEPASLLLERIQKEREKQKPPKKKQLSLI